MSQSYIQQLRAVIGTALVLLPSVAAIIRNEQGHVLFQRRADDGQWSLPAGAIEPGESPWQALVREVYEETGYTVREGFIRGVFGGSPGFRHAYPNGDQVEYTVVVFECAAEETTGAFDVHETLALQFFPHTAVPPLALAYPEHLFHPPTTRDALFLAS